MTTYLPTFHPLPEPQIQYPLVASLMLLNSNAVPSPKMEIPHIYCLGMSGTGKTELVKSIAQHYPQRLQVEFGIDSTGASIRDKLDELFGYGEAGFAFFDNFDMDALRRMDVHVKCILANCKEFSISRISGASNEKGKSEFNTYCFKGFSSILNPLSGNTRLGEMSRRFIIIKHQQAQTGDVRFVYDWDGMQRIYQRIWGEESKEIIQTGIYAKSLNRVAKMRPKDLPQEIDAKIWQAYRVPIAVGCYIGVFESVQAGVEHVVKYLNWIRGNAVGAATSAMTKVLGDFMTKELPRLKRESENVYSSFFGKFDANKIAQKYITDFIQEETTYKVFQGQLDEIIAIMGNYGYQYEKLDSGERGFVKDTPTP